MSKNKRIGTTLCAISYVMFPMLTIFVSAYRIRNETRVFVFLFVSRAKAAGV